MMSRCFRRLNRRFIYIEIFVSALTNNGTSEIRSRTSQRTELKLLHRHCVIIRSRMMEYRRFHDSTLRYHGVSDAWLDDLSKFLYLTNNGTSEIRFDLERRNDGIPNVSQFDITISRCFRRLTLRFIIYRNFSIATADNNGTARF